MHNSRGQQTLALTGLQKASLGISTGQPKAPRHPKSRVTKDTLRVGNSHPKAHVKKELP